MKHVWGHVEGRWWRCGFCYLDRRKWPLIGLWRGWIFDNCTGRE